MSVTSKIVGVLKAIYGLVPGASGLPAHQGSSNPYGEAWKNAAGTQVVTIGADGNGNGQIVLWENTGVTQVANIGNAGGLDGMKLYGGHQYTWTSGAASSPADTGWQRVVAGVVGPTDGSSGAGWLQNTAGRARHTSSVTNTGTVFANLSDLTFTLKAGRKYFGRLVVRCDNSVDGEGVKVDFNGGTATATTFAAGITGCTLGATLSVWDSSNVATAIQVSAIPAAQNFWLSVDFMIVVNAAGTFIPRQAKNTTGGGGTLSVFQGTFMTVEDCPN